MRKREVCEYCLKVIHTFPFRIRAANKMYKYNFAHKLCKDRLAKKNKKVI